MTYSQLLRRFLLPRIGVTLLVYFRSGALVSPRAEVEFSPNLHLGRKTKVSSFTKIKSRQGPLAIGDRCSIATGCFISTGSAGITIGDDCLLGANCVIVSSSYKYADPRIPCAEQGHDSKGVVIGNNVLIGSNTVIVDGTSIGNNVIIGGLSVVSGSVANNTVVQGNPAAVVFTRR